MSCSVSVPSISPTPGRTRIATALAPFPVKVEIAEPLGADTLIFSRIGEREVVCRVTPEAGATTGARITLQANMNHMHLFDPESGIAL